MQTSDFRDDGMRVTLAVAGLNPKCGYAYRQREWVKTSEGWAEEPLVEWTDYPGVWVLDEPLQHGELLANRRVRAWQQRSKARMLGEQQQTKS